MYPNVSWSWSPQIYERISCCSKWLFIFSSSNISMYTSWCWRTRNLICWFTTISPYPTSSNLNASSDWESDLINVIISSHPLLFNPFRPPNLEDQVQDGVSDNHETCDIFHNYYVWDYHFEQVLTIKDVFSSNLSNSPSPLTHYPNIFHDIFATITYFDESFFENVNFDHS